MHRAFVAILMASTALGFAAGHAHAQTSGSNQVYVGQTGETNTVLIEQEGNGNNVGANRDALRFNQNGLDNLIDIYQYGYSNSVGATLRDVRRAAYGLDQIGDSNSLEIDQINTDPGSGNIVEAIYQNSSSAVSNARNILIIRQETAAGAGPYNHRVGQIVQRDFSTTPLGGSMRDPDETISVGLGDNIVSIVQTGGGIAGGNTVETVMQEGTANEIDIRQAFDRNLVDRVQQTGALNAIRIDQVGSNNLVAEVAQNNEGRASLGNTVVLNFAASGTGRSAIGVTGAFREAAGALGVDQASVFQTGDANDVNFSVAQGDNNLFGFMQVGDGNDVLGTVSGTDNETAALQIGDGNNVRFDLDGVGNVLAVQQDGNNNRVNATLAGNLNNAGAFTGPVPGIAKAADLAPGLFRQLGDSNLVDVAMTGDRQLVAVLQQGNSNEVAAVMSGSGHQAVIIQTGNGNLASLNQSGQNNTATIRQ